MDLLGNKEFKTQEPIARQILNYQLHLSSNLDFLIKTKQFHLETKCTILQKELELFSQKLWDHMLLPLLVLLNKRLSKIKEDLKTHFQERSSDKTTLTTTIPLSPSLSLEKKAFKQTKICIKVKERLQLCKCSKAIPNQCYFLKDQHIDIQTRKHLMISRV